MCHTQQIREDLGSSHSVHLAGVHEVPVANLEECLHYLDLGERNRCACDE